MYNIDYFTYWKKPFVKVNRIGIYPLDDPGREKYYSKESYTHRYLRQCDPEVFNQIVSETLNNEADEQNTLNQQELNPNQNLNTISTQRQYDGLNTEPNQNNLTGKFSYPPENNTISSTASNNRTLNQRYIDNLNKKKNLKIKKSNNLQYKSYDRNKDIGTEADKKNDSSDFRKTFNESGRKIMAQSFDRRTRKTGLPVFKDRKARVNPKLSRIMGGFDHGSTQLIRNIRSDSKEMGEHYNPYNFISPHVNRTKRNYVGGLFHC